MTIIGQAWYARLLAPGRCAAHHTQKDHAMPRRAADRDDAPLFRYRVREVAEAQGVNLTQLSRTADVTRETAERYWNNKLTRPTQALIKLARALGCRVEDLIVMVDPDAAAPASEPDAPTSR